LKQGMKTFDSERHSIDDSTLPQIQKRNYMIFGSVQGTTKPERGGGGEEKSLTHK